ncbi:hypothetical protein CFOL_v3_14726 [Cephalotus follicularis]|uniref:Retrovirus-related Pol polyprotein from transposon TNT 1-94 n=1 Tax=Cephalotus follicularis TaxID=3775 RepID=A0A1Q3BTM6_CEPFO|nr:hypothetical protein CFOL_v3_14726 [Cephalotus follicularis]
MNRTLLERARCILSNAGLSKKYWAEAVHTAAYLVNRFPSTAMELQTPQEVWSGTTGDYSGLKVFGCPAYTHVNNGKLDPRVNCDIRVLVQSVSVSLRDFCLSVYLSVSLFL